MRIRNGECQYQAREREPRFWPWLGLGLGHVVTRRILVRRAKKHIHKLQSALYYKQAGRQRPVPGLPGRLLVQTRAIGNQRLRAGGSTSSSCVAHWSDKCIRYFFAEAVVAGHSKFPKCRRVCLCLCLGGLGACVLRVCQRKGIETRGGVQSRSATRGMA